MFFRLDIDISGTIAKIILAIGEALNNFFTWLIGLLPDDPFKLNEVLTVPQPVRDVLGFVNWLFPIGRCLQLVLVWITLILAVWFIRAALKAAHMI